MSKEKTSVEPNGDELIGENHDEINLGKKEPHTEAKHKILDGYLKGWLPILGSANMKIIYLDGFAGPGEYEDGTDGSPIIALKLAMNHSLKDNRILKGTDIIFYFIDKNNEYCENLKKKIEEMDLPESFKWHVECARFDEHLTDVLDQIENAENIIAPTFAFIPHPAGETSKPQHFS
jgi:three-Cys-motif partner protein